jgi:ferredoxin
MKSRVALAYFSGTGVTKAYAGCIGAELDAFGCGVHLFDITPYPARRMDFPSDDFDAFLFGFPVFADFPPMVVNDWLAGPPGGGKPYATFATYGGRTTGYAHYHACTLLSSAGFRLRLCAEFPGRHSFNLAGWRMLEDRPSDADFTIARRFAALAVERFATGDGEGLRLQKPFRYDEARESLRNRRSNTERSWAQPVRFRECGLCGICAEECPTRAMDLQTGESDPALCIECMHCVSLCPEDALKMDERLGAFYPDFLSEWNLTDEILAHKHGRIITAAWEAAA